MLHWFGRDSQYNWFVIRQLVLTKYVWRHGFSYSLGSSGNLRKRFQYLLNYLGKQNYSPDWTLERSLHGTHDESQKIYKSRNPTVPYIRLTFPRTCSSTWLHSCCQTHIQDSHTEFIRCYSLFSSDQSALKMVKLKAQHCHPNISSSDSLKSRKMASSLELIKNYTFYLTFQ